MPLPSHLCTFNRLLISLKSGDMSLTSTSLRSSLIQTWLVCVRVGCVYVVCMCACVYVVCMCIYVYVCICVYSCVFMCVLCVSYVLFYSTNHSQTTTLVSPLPHSPTRLPCTTPLQPLHHPLTQRHHSHRPSPTPPHPQCLLWCWIF